jgi:hypothetical protein
VYCGYSDRETKGNHTNEFVFYFLTFIRNFTQKLDVRGSVRHSKIRTKNPTRCNSVSKFIIPYLYEAQHISGETPPIIRSLKLH